MDASGATVPAPNPSRESEEADCVGAAVAQPAGRASGPTSYSVQPKHSSWVGPGAFLLMMTTKRRRQATAEIVANGPGHAWHIVVMNPTNQPAVTTDGAIERANHLILEFLKVGPRSAAEILAAAEGAKISVRTFQRAAIDLGVEKTKAGFGAGWTWRLPADDAGEAKAPSEQPVSGMLKDTKVSLRVKTEQPAPGVLKHDEVKSRFERAEPVKDREISNLSRAKVIAARIRRLEEIRGKKAPIYAQDSRVLRWAELGIRDPDIREAYERAVTALEDMRSEAFVSVGFLDPFVMQVIIEGDKS